jgi:uncharacterized protein with NRDE domain
MSCQGVPGLASTITLDASHSCKWANQDSFRYLPPPFHLPQNPEANVFLAIYRTNIIEPDAIYAASRGTLVASFLGDLRGDSDLESTTDALTNQNPSYAGFNLLLFQPLQQHQQQQPLAGKLAYGARLVTNAGGGGRIRARALSDAECACGGISNGVDGRGGDAWPKVVQGRAALQSVLDGLSPGTDDSNLVGQLIELLTCVIPFSFFLFPMRPALPPLPPMPPPP